jgi:hypothetical protein
VQTDEASGGSASKYVRNWSGGEDVAGIWGWMLAIETST